eukprot:TRINITY_DN3907_c0_g1_i3.p1 TRINITY_DN3907_c0_g1~~TRINITY_DN3907_c0_g1_i3.p1  ORF type:complete len:167 (-),score=55.77 TRINITY_DN3907_c0_g1_i3:70-570(-)
MAFCRIAYFLLLAPLAAADADSNSASKPVEEADLMTSVLEEDCFDGCGEEESAALSLAQLRATMVKEAEMAAAAEAAKAAKRQYVGGDLHNDMDSDFAGALEEDEGAGIALVQTSAKMKAAAGKSFIVDADGNTHAAGTTQHSHYKAKSKHTVMSISADGHMNMEF